MMGWVETGSCRRYSQSAGDSALVSLPPPDAAGCAHPQAQPGSDAHLNFLAAKALKFASQYSCCADPQQVRHNHLHSLVGRENAQVCFALLLLPASAGETMCLGRIAASQAAFHDCLFHVL